MVFSYNKLIDDSNKEHIIKLITKGTPFRSYTLSEGLPFPISKFTKEVSKRFPDTVWSTFNVIHPVYEMLNQINPIAKIKTSVGDFSVLRNGILAGLYNFAIINHTTEQLNWAGNVKTSLDMLEALSCKREDLPILMATRSQKISRIIEQRLKGDMP